MTNNIEVLRGLVAKWRSESKELRARADRHSNGEYYAELHSKADALENRADELDAALAAMGGQGEAQSLRAALESILPYAQHADSCGDMDAYNNAATPSCGCGLGSAKEYAYEALDAAQQPEAQAGSHNHHVAGCGIGREAKMVAITDGVFCDPCIAPIVKALNDAGLRTVASCCGHEHRPGVISLADGRELVIARNYSEARRIDALFPVDINGEAQAGGAVADGPCGCLNFCEDHGREFIEVAPDGTEYCHECSADGFSGELCSPMAGSCDMLSQKANEFQRSFMCPDHAAENAEFCRESYAVAAAPHQPEARVGGERPGPKGNCNG